MRCRKDCLRILVKVLRHLVHTYRTVNLVVERFPGTVIGENVALEGDITNLELGRNVTIKTGVVLHCGGMDWCMHKGCISIGDNCVIGPHSVLYGCGAGGIHIGNNFDCGPNVGIFACCTDYQSEPRKHIFRPVSIGDSVTIYAHSVISPGVKIGDNAAVAAGSVVTKDVPSNTLVGGSPARVLRTDIKKVVSTCET